MKWNYKIDLKSEKIFSELEKKRGIKIPDEIIELVRKANAATPEKFRYMVGTSEKVFGAVLSFNHGDDDTIFTALDTVNNSSRFPFGIDSFGNYICYDLKSKQIFFWDHETDNFFPIAKSMNEFIDSLF